MNRPRQIARWIARGIAAPVRRAWHWFAHQPRALQIGLIAVVLAALGAGTYYGQWYLKKRGRTSELAGGWKEYADAMRKSDIAGMREALDRVLAVAPNDAAAIRLKGMIDRGEADADAPDLARELLQDHIRHDRLNEAAREAEKVLASNPKDWQARCAVAHHALQVRKDRALAEQQLAQLPNPEDPAARANAGGLLYALRLSDAVGRDASSLRRVIVQRLLPFLRGGTAASAPAAAKIQLLECYLESFVEPSSLSDLIDYVGVADRLADSAVNEAIAASDVPLLIRLASLGSRMRAALFLLREREPERLPEGSFRALVKAVDERTRKTWLAVREKSPGKVEAYIGLADIAFRENNPNGALAQVMDGLLACGNQIELLKVQYRLIALFGTDENLMALAKVYVKAAIDAKTDPMKWCLVANVWFVLDRRDNALEACDQALAIQRNHPTACQIAASIRLQSGDPLQVIRARDLLSRLDETALRIEPTLAALNAQIMVETGLWVLVEDEYKKVLEAQSQRKQKTSAPAVAFLFGIFSAPPDRERAEWVATRAARLMVDDPNSATARLLRFDALYRLAELSVTPDPKGGPPIWDGGRVAAVFQAFETLSLAERAEPGVVALIATLQLKGQRNAPAALRTITPLLAMEGSLSSHQLEVAGSVLAANDRAADAVRVLERAEKRPRPTAGLRVALALAYDKNKQPLDRDGAISRAENTPTRSPREQAELIAAKLLFQREKP